MRPSVQEDRFVLTPDYKATRRLRNWYSRKATFVRKIKYEGLFGSLCSQMDAHEAPHEIVQFIPYWRTRTRQIKATALVLFYGGNFGKARVKFPIMAEYDPAFFGDSSQPFIVWRVVLKSKLIPRIMVVFDSKRWLRCPE